jgi:nitrile hydratase
MNGAHDMGGVHGFGAVVPEPDEPVFTPTGNGACLR